MTTLPTDVIGHIEEFVDKEIVPAAQTRTKYSSTMYNALPPSSKQHVHAIVAKMGPPSGLYVWTHLTYREQVYLAAKGYLSARTSNDNIWLDKGFIVNPPDDGQIRQFKTWVTPLPIFDYRGCILSNCCNEPPFTL
jgi:hypothetical protein